MQNQRLFEIVYILLRKRKVTAKELAQRFEVSTRTIYRDLDTLSLAGIPLYTNKGKQGGIYLMEDYTISNSILTDNEQQHILAALQSYHITNHEDVSSLLNKLSAQFHKNERKWIDVDFRNWDHDDKSSTYFTLLKEAILHRRCVSFTYYNSYGECRKRVVEPLRLLFKGQAWYLIAYCLHANAQRMFKLYRMDDIQTVNQAAVHEIDEKQVSQSFHYGYEDMLHIKAEVDECMAYRLYDEFHPDQFVKQQNGSYIVEMDFMPGEWVYSYLLGYGPNIKVLEPYDIRDQLIQRIHAMLQNYGDNEHEN